MAGSLIKIDEEIVSSAVASVTLTGIDSTYDVYMVRINKLEVETNQRDIKLRFTESGTPNTTANYDMAAKILAASEAFGNASETNATSMDLSIDTGTATGEQYNSIHYIFNANNSSEYTFITMENSVFSHASTLLGFQGGGVFTVASAVDGIQYIGDSTNIDSGTFTLYGLKK